MIHVIGESFAAASYLASKFSWASQDPIHYLKGKIPHPSNVPTSFSSNLSTILHNPVQIHAYQYNSCAYIFDQIYRLSEDSKTSYMVIVFPSFFRNQITVDGVTYQYSFNEKGSEFSDYVQQQIAIEINKFNLEDCRKQFNIDLDKAIAHLNSKRIRFCFIMAEDTFDVSNTDNWVLDPNFDTIRSWALKNQFLNNFEFLNQKGHIELAKLIIPHLTNTI